MATVYHVVPGHPEYGTGSASQYIPAIYSALLIKKFYPEIVLSKISNTAYEGEIKSQGDTVYIRQRAVIDGFDYKKGMVLPVQNPNSEYVTLKIDQGYGYSVAVDKVDELQADINLMNMFAEDGAKGAAQAIEKRLLTSLAGAGAVAGGQAITTISGATTTNTISFDQFTAAKGALVYGGTTAKGTSISTNLAASNSAYSANTGDEITSRLLRFNRYLNENNAPTDGCFAVLPMWARENLLSMTNNNFGLAYATGQNTAGVISGAIPKIAGLNIYFSNNLPLTTEGSEATAILFGNTYATTFATQMEHSRIIDNPFSMGKLLQNVQIYGCNVIKPGLIGVDFWKNA